MDHVNHYGWDPRSQTFDSALLLYAIATRGWTISSFASHIKRHRTTIYKLTKGLQPRQDTVQAVVRALDEREPIESLVAIYAYMLPETRLRIQESAYHGGE